MRNLILKRFGVVEHWNGWDLILKRVFGNGEGLYDIGWDSDDEEFDLEKFLEMVNDFMALV